MKKSGDMLPRMLLMAAIFLTAMYAMSFIAPPPPKPNSTPAQNPQSAPIANSIGDAGFSSPQNASASQGNANIPAAANNSANSENSENVGENAAPVPAPIYEKIKITRPQYSAIFTSRGAAMSSYRLTNYYDAPANDPARNPLTLGAELSPDADALKLTRVAFLPVGGVSAAIELSAENWRLLAAPRDAGISADGVEITDNVLIFSTTRGDLEIRRVYDFSPVTADPKNDFGFRHNLTFINHGKNPLTVNAFELTGAAGIIPDEKDRTFGAIKAVSAHYNKGNKLSREETDLGKFSDENEITHGNRDTAWCGFTNRFFASLLLLAPTETNTSLGAKFYRLPVGETTLYEHPEWRDLFALHQFQGTAALTLAGFSLAPQGAISRNFLYYGGPLDDEVAKRFSPTIGDLATFSWSLLKPISTLLLYVLEYLAVITRNYGLAIVLLTLLVKTALHPLTRKSMKSQRAMAKIQPLLKEIKQKYAKDPQKQQQETMKIFRDNGVNPVGGCLPMLLQMPIFFALYGVFARCFAMRQEPFIRGWIDDLSHPDTIFHLPSLPLFGALAVNPLPLIYLALQFAHMSMMPKSDDPAMQSQQKMMKWMPLIFVFIFYNMPAGLVLYFAVQSLLTIGEQFLIKITNKETPPTDGDGKFVDAKVVPAGVGFKKKK